LRAGCSRASCWRSWRAAHALYIKASDEWDPQLAPQGPGALAASAAAASAAAASLLSVHVGPSACAFTPGEVAALLQVGLPLLERVHLAVLVPGELADEQQVERLLPELLAWHGLSLPGPEGSRLLLGVSVGVRALVPRGRAQGWRWPGGGRHPAACALAAAALGERAAGRQVGPVGAWHCTQAAAPRAERRVECRCNLAAWHR
jgi:hypothetical protein